MPVTVRVMNWNIETLSFNKLMRPGMPNAIARVVNAANVDVLVALEVKMDRVIPAMTALSAALGSVAGGGTGAPTNNWQRFFLSFSTGKEYYCVFIRDLDVIRPVHPVAGTGPAGTENDRLNNVQRNVFQLWPHADWTTSAYLAPMPAVGFRFPLLDVYASSPLARGAKAARAGFRGQPLTNGGYSSGRGFRTPMLAPYVTSALDNFFYGGTNLGAAQVGFGPAMNDSGYVVNVPASIVNAPVVNPADIDLTATAASYAATMTPPPAGGSSRWGPSMRPGSTCPRWWQTSGACSVCPCRRTRRSWCSTPSTSPSTRTRTRSTSSAAPR